MSKIKLGSKSSLYPYPSTILSTVVEGKQNYMQVGFVGVVNSNPGMVSMGIGRGKRSTKALKSGEVVGLAIVNEAMLIKADYVGSRSGEKVDKSKVFKNFTGDHGAFLIQESPVNLELKIIKVMDLGGLDLVVIAEILQVYADEEIMTGNNPDISKINPMIFSMYENKYFTIGDHVADAWDIGDMQEKLYDFVLKIFKGFDEKESTKYFEAHIDKDSAFLFDEGTYRGVDGFEKWLIGAKKPYEKGELKHQVEDFDGKKVGENLYKVSFKVNLQGKEFHKERHFVWVIREAEGNFVFEIYDETKAV